MSSDRLKIYIDRLKNDQVEVLKETLPPDFLDVDEADLRFPAQVEVAGKAYVTEDHLLLHLDVHTSATLPCMICNEPTSHEIAIADEITSIPINSLKTPIYDFSEKLREMILLSAPSFMECHQGNCPTRKDLKKYFAKPSEEGPQYFPFENLE